MAAQSVTFYVDGQRGSNDNDGRSEDTPFKTFRRAMKAVNVAAVPSTIKVGGKK